MKESAINRRIGDILYQLSALTQSPPVNPTDTPHLRELFDVLRHAERSDERAQAFFAKSERFLAEMKNKGIGGEELSTNAKQYFS